MKISNEEKERLENIYQTFLNDEKIKKMKDIPVHRGSNCYEHSFKVVKYAIKKALRYKEVNLEVVLIGAILHDYYLYDWRTDSSKKKGHAKNHQIIASENASRDFMISDKVKKVIESHMWPINIKNFPDTKEARIVSLSDKHVALLEAASSRKYKDKKREKYLSDISHLFD